MPSREHAMEMVLQLFDLYPDANKTETLTASLVALLERYPLQILEKLFDPRNGIHTEHTFMPKAAELTAFLIPLEDKLYERIKAEQRLAELPPPVDRMGRPSYAELRAKFSPPGTVFGLKLLPNSKRDIASMTETEKANALESAHAAARRMAGLQLSNEARATLKRDDGEDACLTTSAPSGGCS